MFLEKRSKKSRFCCYFVVFNKKTIMLSIFPVKNEFFDVAFFGV